ncbi:MAG TPA: GGDEF domain-containing protein [Steroidobacteraceae bacterium]|jgi:two-component system cell cycle response regulator|nr:GGDEF domain-containing protein [Steroidobacteraceae bacterium]
MNVAPMKALLVFDGREDFGHPDRTIIDDGSVACDLIDVEGLNGRLRGLGAREPDVVLLDSSWSAARLLKTALRVREAMPNVPVLLLPDLRAKPTAPQDRGRIAMVRAVRYARRRQRMQEELLYLALRDELTGLYNRRAFRVLASQSLRSAHRLQRQALVFFADLDGLKRINDRFGHGEGDRALSRTAAGFKATFSKESDIVARLGGDEFMALAIEEDGRGADDLCRQLRQNVAARGACESRYALTLSVGVARSDSERPHSLSELMAQADALLYRDKRSGHTPSEASTTDAVLTTELLECAAPTLS